MAVSALRQEFVIVNGGVDLAAQEAQRVVAAAGASTLRLATEDGHLHPLPEPAERALRAALAALAAGDGVAVVPMRETLSSSQAARLLNVSRPHLITLLDRGEIPHSRTGTHRRLRLAEVLAYKVRRDHATGQHLDEILAEAQDSDEYF